MFDGEQFGAAIVAEFKDAIERATAPLIARIGELEEAARKHETDARFTDALIDSDGRLVIVGGNGNAKTLGVVVGKDGEPGAPGEDGITPTFLDAEFEGRTLRLSFDGDRACEFQMATPEYCGVFKDGEAYEPGDMVTWAGSVWHCDKATGEKPGTDSWTLAVKKGRDAK